MNFSTLALSRRHATILLITLITLLGLFLGVFAWAKSYQGKIGPNVWIGPVEVAGLSPEAARALLQERTDRLLTDGIPLRLESSEARLLLASGSSSDALDNVHFDLDLALEQALAKSGDEARPLSRFAHLVGLAFHGTHLRVPAAYVEAQIKDSVRAAFPGRGEPPIEAGFHIQNGIVSILPSAQGKEYDWASFFPVLEERLNALSAERIDLTIALAAPRIPTEQAERLKGLAEAVLQNGPYTIRWEPEEGDGKTWELGGDGLNGLLAPSVDGSISIDEAGLEDLLARLAPDVEVLAQNARFTIENGRVKEFSGSRAGRTIDQDDLRASLIARFAKGAVAEGTDADIHLKTIETEPEVTVDEANDLGITEILGSGTSSYRGSPANRIKNIRNGVRLLNGLLIAPGEEFSLLNALEPFTLENGYFPELVIKGDKIQPEVGGGLCQIGTTTFRATMNSGLPVTQRRNHSLVVSYYNDPGNGNPGTDATIYDPAPDYRFKNDTGEQVLFQAEMLEDTQTLRFTFWGTSDGRKGSYVPPTVLRWIGVGETVNTPTTDLAPGAQKCQEAHVGADTTFTYTIVRPDGTVEETAFPSHYRPLPRMCLIGTDPKDMPQAEVSPVLDANGQPIVDPAPPIETPPIETPEPEPLIP